jgi:hypothetical protein
MRKMLVILLVHVCLHGSAQDKTAYNNAFDEIEKMLSDKQESSFKRAVFLTENAWYGDSMNYNKFSEAIELLHGISHMLFAKNDANKDIELRKSRAIYATLMDTLYLEASHDSITQIFKTPYGYLFDDFFGEEDWTNMFVTTLILKNKGNCHSLPYLFKILSDEFGLKTHLALAPNHLYIKHATEETGWFNIELTSNSFPLDAWLMSSGYITLEAIQNGVYLRALSDKEAVAMCLVDLIQGYQRKFDIACDSFILSCSNLALKYFPNYINALLLKAEALVSCYQEDKNEILYSEMEKTYLMIHDLGYKDMPKNMYVNWLSMSNKQEYQNPILLLNFKNK